jgi:hypothetical protein
MKASIERFMKAGPIVSEVKREHRGQNWKGVKPCPVCGGNLHLTHASYNGHVWGQCETKGCLSWIE